MKPEGIIVASFGTTHRDAYYSTVEDMFWNIKEKYSDKYMLQSFSSEMVRKSLREKQGVRTYNMPEALLNMEDKGIGRISVLALYVIRGDEYEKIEKQSRVYNNNQRLKINFTTPLLDTTEDIKNTAAVLNDMYKGKTVVMMGHGSSNDADISYKKLQDELLKLKSKIFIGTVEGAIGIEDILEMLEKTKSKDVILTPFLLVAGDHAKNDMNSDDEDSWKTILKNNGYNVETELKGLLERDEIREIFYKKLSEIL